ncbi:MAG: phosphatidylglycerophosphatase A [Myxococcota bacterium]
MWFATVGGAGYAPLAPGTWGSAVGLCAFFALERLGLALYGLTLLALLALGVWASEGAERSFGRPDDGRIVIDEVVGQLIALLPLVAPPARAFSGPTWLALAVTGFVVFRLLDIWKPGPVRWAEERFEGGAGVMADDVIAGALAAIPLAAAVYAGSIAQWVTG